MEPKYVRCPKVWFPSFLLHWYWWSQAAHGSTLQNVQPQKTASPQLHLLFTSQTRNWEKRHRKMKSHSKRQCLCLPCLSQHSVCEVRTRNGLMRTQFPQVGNPSYLRHPSGGSHGAKLELHRGTEIRTGRTYRQNKQFCNCVGVV